jgi:hypothetical protein
MRRHFDSLVTILASCLLNVVESRLFTLEVVTVFCEAAQAQGRSGCNPDICNPDIVLL